MATAKSLEFRKRLDRSLVYLFAPHPRHPLRTISTYLLGLMWIAVLGNFIYDWLKGEAHFLRPLWICLGAAALVLGFSYLRPLDDPPPISKGLEAVPPPPMGGLVLVLSPYSPRGGMAFEEFAQLASKRGKTDEDWQQLERTAEQSNFDVPLQAIRYHLQDGSLQHVWLICTDDARDEEGKIILGDGSNPQSPGSWRLASCLERFIQEAPHRKLVTSTEGTFDGASNLQFHYHSSRHPKPKCLVSFFGEQGARDAFRAVNYIFDSEAELVGLEPESIFESEKVSACIAC